jgi:hypothetical protein
LTYWSIATSPEGSPSAFYYVPGWGYVQRIASRRIVDALAYVKREVEAWARENKVAEYTITIGIQGLGLKGSVSATFKVE